MNPNQLSVFLSYAFRPKQNAYNRAEILSLIESSCSIAQADIRRERPSVSFSVRAELTEFGGSLNAELVTRLRGADICIVDISDNNPNVFYELGVLHALNKPSIVLKSAKSESEFPVPADLAGMLLLKYEALHEIQGRLAAALYSVSQRLFAGASTSALSLCNSFWGERPKGTSHILVAPRSSSETEFADLNSPNFIYLDRLGDKDAVVELSVLLARIYPELSLVRYVSNELPRDAYEGNLVLIGGPGSLVAGGASNVMVYPMHSKLGIPLTYSEDCEAMVAFGEEMRAEHSGTFLTRDYGFFAKAPNPYNPDSTVVIVHGIHTLGVLGAARCFSDHPLAVENVAKVLKTVGQQGFWTYFPVDIVNGAAMVPTVEAAHVYPL
jgi:hypothetical protein